MSASAGNAVGQLNKETLMSAERGRILRNHLSVALLAIALVIAVAFLLSAIGAEPSNKAQRDGAVLESRAESMFLP